MTISTIALRCFWDLRIGGRDIDFCENRQFLPVKWATYVVLVLASP